MSDTAAIIDSPRTSYADQMADAGVLAQEAFFKILAQYRFMGLLAGIKGPNDEDEDVEKARSAVMKAIEAFLSPDELKKIVDEQFKDLVTERDQLLRDISIEDISNNDRYLLKGAISDLLPLGHPSDGGVAHHRDINTTYKNQMESIGNANNQGGNISEELLNKVEAFGQKTVEMSTNEALRRANEVAEVRNFFSNLWDKMAKYCAEIDQYMQEGRWLLARAKIHIDVGFIIAEEVIIGFILAGIIALTGGVATVAVVALRAALRVAITVSKLGTRIVGRTARVVAFTVHVRKVDNFGGFPILSPHQAPLLDRRIVVPDHLTANERISLGEGGQGSLRSRDVDAPETGNGSNPAQRENVWDDGTYRNTSDPIGVRRDPADNMPMIQDKDGVWRRTDHPGTGDWYNSRGVWGEKVADNHAIDAMGWERINGTAVPVGDRSSIGIQGIDGLYRNPGPPPEYIIAEVKTGNAWPSKSKATGRTQLDDDWIEGHLDDMFNKGEISQQLRDEILLNNRPVVQKIDSRGNVTYHNTDKTPISWR